MLLTDWAPIEYSFGNCLPEANTLPGWAVAKDVRQQRWGVIDNRGNGVRDKGCHACLYFVSFFGQHTESLPLPRPTANAHLNWSVSLASRQLTQICAKMRKYATQIPHMKRSLIRQYSRIQWKQSLWIPARTDSVRGMETTERQPRGETIYIGSQGRKESVATGFA